MFERAWVKRCSPGEIGRAWLSSPHAGDPVAGQVRSARRLVTTDLLSVWTDPDTAMHAVGTSLGIFDEPVANAGVVGPTETPLRNALFDLLLQLVDDGELEKRACADGRYAFRWRDDTASPASTAVSTEAVSARLDAYFASMPRAMPSGIARAGRDRSRSRLFAMAAP